MTRFLLIIGLTLVLICSLGQELDTLAGNVIIRGTTSNLPEYVINWSGMKVGHSKVRVREKLGSYKVTISEGQGLQGFTLAQFSSTQLLYKNGERVLQFLLVNEGDRFGLKISTNQDVNHWTIPFFRNSNEQIEGGGVQFSEYDNYTRTIVNICQENGIGRGGGSISKWTKLANVAGESSATYYPVSAISTSLGRYFKWNSYAYSTLDCNDEELVFNILDNTVEFWFEKESWQKGVSNYSYQLPSWSLGTILGLQGGTDEVLAKLHSITDNGGVVDAVWIQDWVGKRETKFGSRLNWVWQLDTIHYSNFDQFRHNLSQDDIKLLGYINPFFATDGKYIEEGLENDYFIKEESTSKPRLFDYGGMKGYMLDLFNEEAYSWMKQILNTNLIDNGFDGWMADFAEWYPVESSQNLIESELKKHNEYPVIWAKLNYEVIQESGKELFFFNRSGNCETDRYSAMLWAGDQMVDYSQEDGFLSVFDAYISASESELPLIHSDVGGYTGVKKPFIKNYIRSEDLLRDWMKFEAFTPVFRTHEGLLPEDNSQVYSNELNVNEFVRYSKIHQSLRPYFDLLVKQCYSHKLQYIKSNPDVKLNKNIVKSIGIGDEIIIAFSEEEQFSPPEGWKLIDDLIELAPTHKIFVMIKANSWCYDLIKIGR